MRLLISSSVALLALAGFAFSAAAGSAAPAKKDAAGTAQVKPVPASADEVCPAKIGTKLPNLSFVTVDGKAFDLNTILAKKPTVLIFYRGGW